MNRNAWRIALTIVSVAAIATTGWSLYAVAHHYQAPWPIGCAAVAVFDGAAYAALHLASEASAAGRSAAGARLTALGMAAVSVYLNITHADLIHGGTPAALFFAVPTAALLLVSELSWAGPRAAVRAELGERPFRLPAFGGWAWLLAPKRAGKAVKSRAVAHIEHGAAPGGPPRPGRTGREHTATAVLRDRFAAMDPAEVIRIAHDAHPDAPPAELAALLVSYGVAVDAIQVALVLHQRPAEIDVDRDPDRDAGDAPHDAPQVGELPPPSKTRAILDAASQLGPGAKASEIAARVERINRITVDERYVRTVLSREAKKPQPKGEAGYL